MSGPWTLFPTEEDVVSDVIIIQFPTREGTFTLTRAGCLGMSKWSLLLTCNIEV